MPSKPAAKRRIQNLLLLVLGLIVSCLLIEIGFRVSGWIGPNPKVRGPGVQAAWMGEFIEPSSDPDLVYEYRTGLDTRRRPRFTNSAGMRGPERSIERPPNTIRIAGLGDSVMAGENYPAEQTFLFVLEAMLNEAATTPTRFEVLNFAVGGYNTPQQSIVFHQKALEYDPDWVLLSVVINDWEPPVFFWTKGKDGQVRLADRFQQERRLRFGIGLNPDALPWWAHSVAIRWLRTRFYYDHRVKAFRRAFGEIVETCRKKSIPVLVVVLTEDVAVDQTSDPREKWHRIVRATYEREAAEGGDLALLELYAPIKEYLAERGIDSFSRFWTSPGDPHPNAEGHRLIAELIFRKLESLGILGQRPRP